MKINQSIENCEGKCFINGKRKGKFMALRYLILSLGLLAVFSAPAVAIDYTITNLAVDVEGSNAIDAREKALAQARSNAFSILKKRISAEGQAGVIPTPDDAAIASMVNSFEINREKLSKNRYLASVNVVFSDKAVQSYMRKYTGAAQSNSGNQNQTAVYRGNPPSNTPRQQAQVYTGQSKQPVSSYPSYAGFNQSKVKIIVTDIRQWVSLKSRLESISTIQNVDLEKISSQQAVVNLTHRGNINDLQNDFIGRGLRLYANTDATRTNVPYLLMITRG